MSQGEVAAATELIRLALRNITASWWKAANYCPAMTNSRFCARTVSRFRKSRMSTRWTRIIVNALHTET
jgi:hypothetical protein